MKSNFFLFIYFLYFFINITKIYSNPFHKKKNIFTNIRLLDEEGTDTDSYYNPIDSIDITDISDTINNTDSINTEIKNSSRRFSPGLIVAIVVPCVVIIIGLIVIGFVCNKIHSTPVKPNLPNKNIDVSSSELNKEENSSQSNQRIKGGESTVNI